MQQDNTAIIASSEDALWAELRQGAIAAALREPSLRPLLQGAILERAGFADALAHLLERKLGNHGCPTVLIADTFREAAAADPGIITAAERDIRAWMCRDPVRPEALQVVLFFKGFTAIQGHRLAHWLWRQKRHYLAWHLQSRMAEILQIDIHPAAILGAGLFFDHATGIVIGETSVVGDDVSMLQSVTLGGSGKERGDRHPKIAHGVLIGAGAKILGNIKVGEEARIAAGSVVLQDVPPHVTVAGVPAKQVGAAPPHPAECMDHSFDI